MRDGARCCAAPPPRLARAPRCRFSGGCLCEKLREAECESRRGASRRTKRRKARIIFQVLRCFCGMVAALFCGSFLRTCACLTPRRLPLRRARMRTSRTALRIFALRIKIAGMCMFILCSGEKLDVSPCLAINVASLEHVASWQAAGRDGTRRVGASVRINHRRRQRQAWQA